MTTKVFANDHAKIPTKVHDTDSGFDVTVYARKNGAEHDDIFQSTMFHTGLFIEPPEGYYFELVARSSLQKEGYMLANAVGIIDNSYRGEIFVPLVKFNNRLPDLKLPARVAQLIPRKIEPMRLQLVDSYTDLSRTVRGFGGFGSTN